MAKKHYIDTGSADSRFCMPKIGIPYKDWLLNKYNKSVMTQDGIPAFYGIAQQINHYIFEAREHNHTLVAFGQHAKEAAKVIQELAHHSIDVEVVK